MRRLPIIAAVLIFILGAVIRMTAGYGFKGTGFDEVLYRDYILMIDKVGLAAYPGICEYYIQDQQKEATMAKLPPTRFLYIFSGWVTKRLAFGDAPPADFRKEGAADIDPAMVSLHLVSLTFSILMVGLCGLAAWRMGGTSVGLGVLALLAASPLSIHMGKHALVDGFFAFWATLCLWLLWENLKRPNDARWLTALVVALALMVTAKENAFFVYVALVALVAINRWAQFGVVTKKLALAGLAGPLLGVLLLVTLSGGLDTFINIYALLVSKAQNLDYAIRTGDGPWFRYLLEIILIDPIVFILALSGLFTLPQKNRTYGYLIAFVVVTYAIMCNVRYAMNMRYTTIWALPLAALAVAQLTSLAESSGRYARVATVAAIVGICAYNLGQYHVYFVDNPVYEPIPSRTLQAVKMIKDAPR